MRKYVLALLVVCYAGIFGLAADGMQLRQVLPDLGEADYQALEQGKIIDGSTVDGGSILPYFVPGTEAEKQAQAAQQAQGGFSIAALSYIPYGKKLHAMAPLSRQLAIFNAIRAISTQEGLQYISWRAGNKPKLLIERSAYMEDEKNLNTLLPDPVATTFPYSVQSYVYQRDTSFGGNRYLHTYTNSDQEIFVAIRNLSAMKVLGIFTAVPKEKLTINMGTYQLDNGLLLVALTTIADRDPVVSILGLHVDLPSAFMRRITALQHWFVAQLDTIETK
ncbi:MAG: DUF6675 family protein [Sphaerochaeta sp.]|jgi:hypothetical protein|uniref:DUF6675 family protein n=1 Tax=Sphaerochaeta sp. TaxID=1972642 RepID=UPI002FCC464B